MKNRRNKIIYVSGPYTAKTRKLVEKNIQKARDYAVKIWDLGFSAHCPHLNSYHFHDDVKKTSYEDFIEGDLAVIDHCDALFMMPDWKKSKGAVMEHEHAVKRGIPVFHSLKELDEWGKNGPEDSKIVRLRKAYGMEKQKAKLGIGEIAFFVVIGFILSVFAGVYIANGNYFVTFIFLNLLILQLVIFSFRHKNR